MNLDKQDIDIKGIISRSPWFEGLPAEIQARLADAARIRSYRKNSYLYTIGETSRDVYCILSGRIRLLLSSAIGQEYAINDLEAEAWLGEQFLATDLPTMLNAKIIEKSTVLVIPRSVILAVGEQHPLMYKNIFFHYMPRARGMTYLLMGMAFYPLRSRLAGWFIELFETHAQESDEGVYLDVHLSQSDFAQLSLGSRQRINKILSEWRERGIIELHSNRYFIRDMDALRRETELKDQDD